jgi:hypothetical protein
MPETPFCGVNDGRPRPGRQPSTSLGAAARFTSRIHLRALPRCLEFVSTTDVRVTSTRSSTIFGDPSARRGKTRRHSLRDLWNQAFPPEVLEDAGPPCGHPASNGRALDGAPPALVCSAAMLALPRKRGGKPPQLYRLADDSTEAKPLTPQQPLLSLLGAPNLWWDPSKDLRPLSGPFLVSSRFAENSIGWLRDWRWRSKSPLPLAFELFLPPRVNDGGFRSPGCLRSEKPG